MDPIAQRLNTLRGKRTMQEMAALCGATRQAWQLWESGKREIPAKKARLLVQALGISLDWLYLGKEKSAERS